MQRLGMLRAGTVWIVFLSWVVTGAGVNTIRGKCEEAGIFYWGSKCTCDFLYFLLTPLYLGNVLNLTGDVARPR